MYGRCNKETNDISRCLGSAQKIFNEGKIDISIVEKINKRNAETLVCDYLPIS